VAYTTRSALIAAALVLAPALLLYLRTVRGDTPVVAGAAPQALPPTVES
jgi:hypothetical protein